MFSLRKRNERKKMQKRNTWKKSPSRWKHRQHNSFSHRNRKLYSRLFSILSFLLPFRFSRFVCFTLLYHRVSVLVPTTNRLYIRCNMIFLHFRTHEPVFWLNYRWNHSKILTLTPKLPKSLERSTIEWLLTCLNDLLKPWAKFWWQISTSRSDNNVWRHFKLQMDRRQAKGSKNCLKISRATKGKKPLRKTQRKSMEILCK